MVLLLLHIFLQIILEMVPVSSSSSIILLLGQQNSESVQLLLHSFTVMMIGLYFLRPWWRYLRDFLTLKKDALVLGCAVISADLVTAGFYFFWKWVGIDWLPLWFGLVGTGLLLVSLSWIPRPHFIRPLNDDKLRSQGNDVNDDVRTTVIPKAKQSGVLESSFIHRIFTIISWIPRPHFIRPLNDDKLRSQSNDVNDGKPTTVIPKAKQSGVLESSLPFFILGLIQGIALLPGISRLGSTYVIARWLGYSPEKAFEYSWLIGWPLLVAGSAKGWWQVYKTGELVQLLNWPVMLAMLTAAVVSWYVLCWFAQLVKKEKVAYFAWWVFASAVFAFLVR